MERLTCVKSQQALTDIRLAGSCTGELTQSTLNTPLGNGWYYLATTLMGQAQFSRSAREPKRGDRSPRRQRQFG